MRAAAWNDDNTLDIIDLPRPVPAAGEVLVRVTSAGICGSDLHFYRGQFRGIPGMVPGHEIAGVVESGEGFAPGTPVAVQPTIPCGACAACRRGQTPVCPDLGMLGISRPGGLQEYIAVPEANVFPLPAGLPPSAGSLAEPLAVAVRALNRAALEPGSRVLVLGAGAIGLVSLVAADETAAEVAITARYPHQHLMALSLGASAVHVPGSPELRAWARTNPIDLVIETVGGNADTLAEAVSVVRPGGTVVALGLFTADVPVSARKIVNQEVRLIGSVLYGHESDRSEFGDAVAMLERHAGKLMELQTHSFPLEQANEAFARALDKRMGPIKVSIEVSS